MSFSIKNKKKKKKSQKGEKGGKYTKKRGSHCLGAAVVYFDQQMGAPHAVHWSKSFESALKYLYLPLLYRSLRVALTLLTTYISLREA